MSRPGSREPLPRIRLRSRHSRSCRNRSRSPLPRASRSGCGERGVRHRHSSRFGNPQEAEASTGAASTGRGQPKALFLMGLPGAGKSTVKKERMSEELFVNVEPDQLKRYHKDYSSNMSEETDTEVHRWSVRRAVDAFEDAVRDSRRRNVLFDSSGSNSQWLARRLETARDAGYHTQLLWVDVPVEIALLRNRDRAKSRGQWCPENIILDKAKVLQASFEELRATVDVAERLQNWDPNGHELRRAQEDLYLYPAPRSRATVRPGDPSYGEAPPGARPPSPTPGSRRTIRIGPWKRSDEVMKAKSARLKWMDETYRGDREKYVLEEVLAGREILLERNMFPYALPPGMEHWTIWARSTMEHDALCVYIEGWLNARQPHNVTAWNYDDNRQMRTIDVWHVHVYFQGADGEPPKFCTATQGGELSTNKTYARSPCSV
ncbi:hypothetical protein AK812_SmicGene20617 [Symbiodinium microadriaticum]|uniref:Zeta toxin domain-containing protein n=1 Tax=Symbiodinium microadriaticum TaxID=2951 RepID=A0A1Q9DPJ3_SYMMI|nr:hypothetical protein AK812_SmicGene20617 [Symbiodinium microadriaticum]